MINEVVGNGDPSIVGSHMEMRACSCCVVASIAADWKGPLPPDTRQTPNLDPALYHEKNYVSPDGRTPVDHYMRGGVECIDVMRAVSTPEGFQAHCHLTAFKYLYRLGEKDDPIREVKKARDYLMWLQQSLEEEAAKNPTKVAQAPDKGRTKGYMTELPESD